MISKAGLATDNTGPRDTIFYVGFTLSQHSLAFELLDTIELKGHQ
jgi:hypothetical protein